MSQLFAGFNPKGNTFPGPRKPVPMEDRLKQSLQAIGYFYSLFIPIFVILLALSGPAPAQEGKDEETYSISLVRTAEENKEIIEVEGKKILTEPYTVKKGDYLWSILRQKGLLDKRNSNEIISLLKKLNPSLKDLNLIYPGEKIIVPLIITPIKEVPTSTEKGLLTPVPLEEIKDLAMEYYTIRPGDCLIKVVKDLYNIPEKDLYDEYLNLLKRMNPSIGDLNNVYPGQRVKIPIYSPEIVRLPIKPAPTAPVTEPITMKEDLKRLGGQLKEIFIMMGEEWIDTGKHFIPLKAGGQINLKADSYPIIDLRNGNRVIIDIYNELPEKMAGLIMSSWENYRIVHLQRDDDLKKAIDRILDQCGYDRIYRAGEPLLYEGDIPMRISGDWIVKMTPGLPAEKDNIIILDFCDEKGPRPPDSIRAFLRGLGIKYIDYPPITGTMDQPPKETEALKTGDDRAAIIEMLLKLTGIPFSRDLDIPVYQSEKTDFDLIIKADFFLNIHGKDCVIDLKGLGPDIVTLLRDHGFPVLSITHEEPSSAILKKALDFLALEYDSKPHTFLAIDRKEPNNIRMSIPGIVFRDSMGRNVLATHLNLPVELVVFLEGKGYLVWCLSPS